MVARLFAAAVLLLAFASPSRADPAPASVSAGLELVMAVDGSASISGGALEFQLRGHAAAIRDPAVVEAAARTVIAATLTVFSGPHSLRVLVPWTVIRGEAEAEAFAAAILAAPREELAGATALGSAIEEAGRLFEGNGIEAPRRVIDIVSNGFSNAGLDPAVARDRAVKRGVTVNALAILDEYPWLEEYYAESVIGGLGAFVHTAMDKDSFVDALKRKLVTEIVALPAGMHRPPAR